MLSRAFSLSTWIVVSWLIGAPPAAAREQRVLETPALEAPLSPAAVSPLAVEPAVQAPAALAEAAPGLVPAAQPAAAAAEAVAPAGPASPSAAASSPEGEQADGEAAQAGRRRFDNAAAAGDAPDPEANLFALSRRASDQQKKAIDRALHRAGHAPIYVDSNVLMYATNGDPQWLYFFFRARRVEVVPQVSRESDVASLAAQGLTVKAKTMAARERRFRRYLGRRLDEVRDPAPSRTEAMADFLRRVQVSAKDARMLSEVTLTCKSSPCYLLTRDYRLAKAVEEIRTPGNQKKLAAFLAERRAVDPGFPDIRWPVVVAAP